MKRLSASASAAVVVLASACAAPPEPVAASARPAADPLRSGAAPSSSSVAPSIGATAQPQLSAGAVPAAAPSASTPTAAAASPSLGVTFHREIDGATTALALEKPPHAAALGGDAVWIHDDRGWRAEPLPASLRRAAPLDLSVFYGRDYRVRLAGGKGAGAEAKGVYLRWLPGGFKAEHAEIGRLSSLSGPLVSVLGTEDPEIVCRAGDICLVKGVTGWSTIAAPGDLQRVALGGGVGWAIAGRALLRLGKGWESAGPAGSWDHADALFATRDRAWVIETQSGRLHAFDGAGWRVTPSPVAGPRALWGTGPDALWLAGEGGLAYFDGTMWRQAADAPGPLAAVAGRGADDVWIAGARGVFRIERAR